jgi:hypothetical protein
MKHLLISLSIVVAFAASAFAQSPVYPRDQILAVLHDVARGCPRAWERAHVQGDPERLDFIIYAVRQLDAVSDGKVGGNWRRADVGDLSADGLSYVATDGRVYFADVIARAKEHVDSPWTPEIAFQSDANSLLRDRAGNYAPHGFVSAGQLPQPAVACSASGGAASGTGDAGNGRGGSQAKVQAVLDTIDAVKKWFRVR